MTEIGWLGDGDWILNQDYSPSGVRLLQVGDVGQGKFIGKSNRYITEARANELNCTFLKAGDVLISRMPDPIGRACILPDLGYQAITAVDVTIFRPNLSVADPGFLVHYLNSDRWFSEVASSASGATRARISRKNLELIPIPLPPIAEQKRIAAILNEQMAAVEKARAAAEKQKTELGRFVTNLLAASLSQGPRTTVRLADCLIEVKKGIGAGWSSYPVLGATREGLAPAKEPVGKSPERYKLVDEGTIFYNPMRILLGSIAFVDAKDAVGITSPDYVVFKTDPAVLHFRWFYHWLRSPFGEQFIKGLTRGAVRERLLFRRLSEASVEIPGIAAQRRVADSIPLVRAAANKVEEKLGAIARLPTAFLRRAFSGQL